MKTEVTGLHVVHSGLESIQFSLIEQSLNITWLENGSHVQPFPALLVARGHRLSTLIFKPCLFFFCFADIQL